MEEDFKRKKWSVTYTKHVKQKRKVYQDGFLHLHVITNKVMLFDDCEKLLECRILKGDEVVAPGETLSFNAYLVDVGDPDGGDVNEHNKPVPDSRVHQKHPKITVLPRPGLSRRKKFRSPSVSSVEGQDSGGQSNEQTRTLSPSQKIIREFKRSELQRYGETKGSSGILAPGTTVEWQVLYTTQMTQKAKKFHDGFLQLSTRGSLGRQVMLHDASRKLLTTRFLKKDEVVQSGESILFDSHLVEIGEAEEDHKPFVDLTNERNSGISDGETKVRHEQNCCKNCDISVEEVTKKNRVLECETQQTTAEITQENITEWQVMYTAQVTQKAKKYHDGFLRLSHTGSLGRQIMLCDASKTLLESRFLKKAETISSGESITFNAYLVDIGEPEGETEPLENLKVQGNSSSYVGKAGIRLGQQKCLASNKSIASSTCSTDWNKLSNIVPVNKPLRDASQILSVLVKPTPKESCTVEGTDANISELVSSIKGIKGSDADGDHSEDSLGPGQPNYRSSENVDMGGSGEIMDNRHSSGLNSFNGRFYSKASSSCNQLSENTEAGNPDQCHQDSVEETKGCGEAFPSEISCSPSASPCGPCDDEMKSVEHLNNKRQMDEWPTFDLGF